MRERPEPAAPPPSQGSTRGTSAGARAASAIRYDGGRPPQVVASGKGQVAERILAVAREHGIPVREDPALAEALAALEVEADVPPELYRAVAEALLWAYRLQRRSIPGPGRR
jgi:flagellar biosynthesis protein